MNFRNFLGKLGEKVINSGSIWTLEALTRVLLATTRVALDPAGGAEEKNYFHCLYECKFCESSLQNQENT